ncbi:MAG: PAS-domain containing protein [Alphaproteobacteria bacterium]|nr:PAS-domain containing protein [Alphaproteobacteria bacterium]
MGFIVLALAIGFAMGAGMFWWRGRERAQQVRTTAAPGTHTQDLAADRLRDFSNAAFDWWWEMDRDLRFTYLSDRFEEVFGIPPASVIGRQRTDLNRADYEDPKWTAHLADLEARRPFRNFQTTFVDADGKTRHVAISGTPFRDPDGQFAGYRGVGFDQTETREQQAALAEKATVLEAVFRHVDQGVALLDADLRVLACNDRLLELLDLPKERFGPGSHFDVIVRQLASQGEYGQDEKEREAMVAERLRLARERVELSHERTRPNGVVLQIRGRPLPEGRMIVTYTDITETKRRDAALHQAQKMEAMGQLTGGIAHDFNNLLTVIIGGVADLQALLPENGPARRLAGMIEHAANRGSELTGRLLAFSRQQELNPRDFDLNQMVMQMSGMIRRVIGSAITVQTDLSDDPAIVHADPAQCETALLNLVINARDAMPQGGLLTIATRREQDHGVLIVRDTGHGMTREVLTRLVEPFFTTKQQSGGTGLGLSMVYGYARQSGGDLRVASEPGAGAEVSILLPLQGRAGSALALAGR